MTPHRLWLRWLLSAALLASGAAQAQNVMILTTGAVNTSVSDSENNYMPYIVNEYAAPLTFADFADGSNQCANITQPIVDPITSQTKLVTCNQSELVNGSAMPANFFDAGYDLLVVASAYTTIDPADWAVIEEAVETRKVRGVVLYIDSVNTTNRTLIPNLINASMGVTVGSGPGFSGGNYYFPLNTSADVASYFSALPRMELNSGFNTYTNVPTHLALYGGTSGPSTGGTTTITDPTTSAAAVFITHAESFSGSGACVFGIPDIGWGRSGTGLNLGKLGPAFLSVFNDANGPCATPLANAPILKVEKTTTVTTATPPANGSTVPYMVEVSNTSAATALNVEITDSVPAGMAFGTWTCTVHVAGTPAATCPGSLPTSGALNASISTLPADAVLRFMVDATVIDNTLGLTNTATLTLPAGATCDGGASPCQSQVVLPSANTGGPSTGTSFTPVPTLSHAMLALLASVVGGLGMLLRRRTHT